MYVIDAKRKKKKNTSPVFGYVLKDTEVPIKNTKTVIILFYFMIIMYMCDKCFY